MHEPRALAVCPVLMRTPLCLERFRRHLQNYLRLRRTPVRRARAQRMPREDDQSGSTPGLLCEHRGIMGDMACAPSSGRLPSGWSLPRCLHTHRFNCLCFFHYFYCLFSALRAPWPCGKVTMAAVAACSHNWALCRAGNGRWRSGKCTDRNEFDSFFYKDYYF